MESTKLKINCTKDGKTIEMIEINREISNFADHIKEQLEKGVDDDIIELEGADPNAVQFLIKFCESHDWKRETMKWKNPWEWKSNDLKDYIDEKSYAVFKEQLKCDKIPNKPVELEAHAEKIAPIIDLAFTIRFNEFQKICNCALQIPAWVDLDKVTDQDIKSYQDKWGITEDMLRPEKQLEIMKEFEPIFNFYNKKWQEEFDTFVKQQEGKK